MAETKFTPGPWETGGLSRLSIFSGAKHIAYALWGYGVGEDAARKNTHLIAAAPELYEVGEPFESAMNQEDTGDLSDETPVTVIIGERVHDFTLTLADFRRLQQVRAKARGEEV